MSWSDDLIKKVGSVIGIKNYLLGGNDASVIGNVGDRLKIQIYNGLKEGGIEGAITLTTGGTTYEAKVGASKLANRRTLTITAMDDMYWGYTNAVTTTTGTPLSKNQQVVFELDPEHSSEIWLVASGNSKSARITESP